MVWGAFADGQVEFNLPTEPGTLPVRSVEGPAGRVAVGRAVGSSGEFPGVNDLSQARIWYLEGEEWRTVEHTGLPNGASALYDIASWSGGYVAVGSSAAGYASQATAVVLTSADGRNWTVTSQLSTTWSGWGSRVRITSTGEVLVEVSIAVCSVDSRFIDDGNQVTVPSLWAAVAPTGNYNQLPANTLAAISPTKPTPADGFGCVTDYFSVPEDEREADFGRRLGSLAAVGERLVVLDPTSTTVSVTDDLNTWNSTRLPGAVADPLGSLLYGDGNGRINVVTMSSRPLGAGYVPGSTDPDAWVSTAWVENEDGDLQRVAPWRPVFAENLTFVGLEQRDAVVRLLALAPAANPGDPQVLRIAESAPTTPQPAPTCTPGPLADCNFVTLEGAELANADLGGIQLYGATIRGGTFTNANLENAQLARATIEGASFAGAYLTTATLLATRFVDTDLTGASMAYADLSAATFVGSVLTNAIVGGAVTDGTTVDAATTCPSGQPPAAGAGVVIAVACGLL